jgi:hypothetical protein
MMLPRNQQLLDDIFAAGILPDRTAPGTPNYAVSTSILQDADPHVRLEALLVLSELPGSAREAGAILDVIAFPENARDAWIPDAVSMAGASHGPGLINDLVRRPVRANDSLATNGMRRAVHKLARFQAAKQDAGMIVGLISAVPQATPAFAVAMLNGIAEGWPQESAPTLTAEQRTALRTAARDANADLAAAFARVAARWNLPNAFKPE